MTASIGTEAMVMVTFFRDHSAQTKHEEMLPLHAIASRIGTATAPSKAALPWLKLATFGDLRTDANSLRHNNNVLTISGIEADYDAELIGFDEARQVLLDAGVAAILYTSPSHAEDAPRWRVLCPLSEEMPPEARSRSLSRLNGLFNGIFSTESWTLSQSYYYGSINRNPSHRVEVIAGTPIDLMPELDAAAIGRPEKPRPTAGNGQHGPSTRPEDISDSRIRGLLEALLDRVRHAQDGSKHHTLRDIALTIGGYLHLTGWTEAEAVEQLITALPTSVEDWEVARATAAWGIANGLAQPLELEDRPNPYRAGTPPFGTYDQDARHPHGEGKPNGADADQDPPSFEEKEQPQAEAAQGPEPAAAERPAIWNPWDDPPTPSWPSGVLPRVIEETLAALCLRDGLDFAAMAMSYVAAASGAAPKDARFTPFRGEGWRVPPIIWLMLIADSGQRKTQTLDHALAIIRQRHGERWKDYRDTMRRSKQNKDSEDEERPVEPHPYIINDITPEKLQMLLAENDRGLMYHRDEIAGILEFGRYTQGKGSNERAMLLEAYEGGPYTIHRVGRDTVFIPNAALTIIGNIQPDRLAQFKGLEADGLLQRFQTLRVAPVTTGLQGVVVHGKSQLDQQLDRLLARPVCGQRYNTTTEGAELIAAMQREGEAFGRLSDFGKGFQGYAYKLHGTHARLALILHMLDDPDRGEIPVETVERAGRLTMFLLQHAAGFYASVPGSAIEVTRAAASYILRCGKTRFVASMLTTSVAGCRGMTLKQVAEVLAPLVAGGWVAPQEPFPGNNAWLVTPGLPDIFADRFAAETKRAAEARRRIQRLLPDRS